MTIWPASSITQTACEAWPSRLDEVPAWRISGEKGYRCPVGRSCRSLIVWRSGLCWRRRNTLCRSGPPGLPERRGLTLWPSPASERGRLRRSGTARWCTNERPGEGRYRAGSGVGGPAAGRVGSRSPPGSPVAGPPQAAQEHVHKAAAKGRRAAARAAEFFTPGVDCGAALADAVIRRRALGQRHGRLVPEFIDFILDDPLAEPREKESLQTRVRGGSPGSTRVRGRFGRFAAALRRAEDGPRRHRLPTRPPGDGPGARSSRSSATGRLRVLVEPDGVEDLQYTGNTFVPSGRAARRGAREARARGGLGEQRRRLSYNRAVVAPRPFPGGPMSDASPSRRAPSSSWRLRFAQEGYRPTPRT